MKHKFPTYFNLNCCEQLMFKTRKSPKYFMYHLPQSVYQHQKYMFENFQLRLFMDSSWWILVHWNDKNSPVQHINSTVVTIIMRKVIYIYPCPYKVIYIYPCPGALLHPSVDVFSVNLHVLHHTINDKMIFHTQR